MSPESTKLTLKGPILNFRAAKSGKVDSWRLKLYQQVLKLIQLTPPSPQIISKTSEIESKNPEWTEFTSRGPKSSPQRQKSNLRGPKLSPESTKFTLKRPILEL